MSNSKLDDPRRSMDEAFFRKNTTASGASGASGSLFAAPSRSSKYAPKPLPPRNRRNTGSWSATRRTAPVDKSTRR